MVYITLYADYIHMPLRPLLICLSSPPCFLLSSVLGSANSCAETRKTLTQGSCSIPPPASLSFPLTSQQEDGPALMTHCSLFLPIKRGRIQRVRVSSVHMCGFGGRGEEGRGDKAAWLQPSGPCFHVSSRHWPWVSPLHQLSSYSILTASGFNTGIDKFKPL